MMPSANNNNPRTAILGNMLWFNEDISSVLALQRTSPEARWNDNIGDYLKGEDMCLVNLQVKHDDGSHVVLYVPLSMFDEQTMLSSNIAVRCRYQDICTVMNGFHATRYDNKTM
jgi:hypothetical protein